MNLLQLLSDAVSTLTIISCMFQKVPQIMSLKRKKSAEGIHIQAMFMEITSFSITTLYNYINGYSIMTYLEYPVILVQIYFLLYYTLKYKNMLEHSMVSIMAMLYFIIVIGCGVNFIPNNILNYLLPFCTPLSGFAKITYIYGIIKSGNAEAVSLTTWVISVSTNIARIFTVYMDSADIKLIVNFTVSSVLSVGVLVTALLYQSKPYLSNAKGKDSNKSD